MVFVKARGRIAGAAAGRRVRRTAVGSTMATRYATVEELRRGITTEILVAAGLPRTGLLQRLLAPLVWPVANRFASLMSQADRLTAESGLPEAARWLLHQFVDDVRLIGADQIPTDGPLIVASNHPGTYDILAIVSAQPRDDLKIPASDVPFVRGLHATSSHLIYTPHDPHVRMTVLRESMRHLQAGGSLLIFASAQVDPDPAFLPGAAQELGKWSGSLPLLMRRVPEARLVIAIVRGVLAPACYNHPFTRHRSEQRLRQFTAEFLQVGQQILLRRRFHLRPTVQFAAPVTLADLGTVDPETIRQAIITRARCLLESGAPGIVE